MQYMLLIYVPADLEPGEEMNPAWRTYTEALHEAGAYVEGDALQGTDTAATVRVRDGETIVTDGPFAETKEMLGGYYIIDVPDLDAALDWGGKLAEATTLPIEVRPFRYQNG
jgi:hypothetical protein